MPCRNQRLRVACALLCLALATPALYAAPAADALLPATTKGFVSTPNFDILRENWSKTQIGQMMHDPIMKPFLDDLRVQLQQKWTQSHQKLGLSWDDLEGVPAGEVAMAMIQPSKGESALAVVVDVTGHEKETAALLEKVAQSMAAEQAKRSQHELFGTRVTIYDVPKKDERPARQAIYFVKNNMLVASDHLKIAEGILSRFEGKAKDALVGVGAYEAVMARCTTAAGELAPHVRWFVEPFGYVEAARAAGVDRHHRKGTDMLKILKNQGFTAIQGVGGFVNFATEKYEMLHRTAIYAPAVKAGAEKYELAARMLDFPNGGSFQPQPWVPREIATYASVNLNIPTAFEASKTLVNEIVGDEVFEDVIKSIIDDPNGPQIDIRKDLIGHLGRRATIVSDYVLPITPKSERMLFAVETTNEAALRAAIEKSMNTDPDAKRRDFNGHIIWEIVDAEEPVPMVTIENHPAFANAGGDEEDEESKEKMLPNSAVTVAYGQLLVGTHYDFLVKILSEMAERDQLAQSTDYQIISSQLEKVAGKIACVQTFSRTDEQYRAVYELIRSGRMPEAETMLAKALNSVLGDGKDGVLRTQKIDGSKLPDFEAVRRYFGPAGNSIISEDNGWFITGFTLSKETPDALVTPAP